MPVFGADIASGIGWYASAIDDDTQEDESDDGYDFDYSKDEFD